jgi:hypothetical protein
VLGGRMHFPGTFVLDAPVNHSRFLSLSVMCREVTCRCREKCKFHRSRRWTCRGVTYLVGLWICNSSLPHTLGLSCAVRMLLLQVVLLYLKKDCRGVVPL